ncbi:MAG: hypothetical protein B7Y99_06915 [Caulobacterales bacterium 32-69-10]|nr:MAG: hypothetical protein B7Y99_06915 [Caulobacterales bacterium 32-69-10]
MIIQLAFTALFLGLLFVTAVRRFGFSPLKYGIMLFCCFGMYFVWNPNQMTHLARMVGIGRGADLIAYATTGLFFLAVVAGVIRERRASDTLTQLVRKLALRDARQP